MATVEICDRCEAFGKNDAMNYLEFADHAQHICDQCEIELKDWWNNPPFRGGQVVTRSEQPLTIDPKMREMARVIAEEYVRAQAMQKEIETKK